MNTANLDYNSNSQHNTTGLLFILSALSFIPGISIQIRRLRDIGKAPEWILLSFIPFAAIIFLFWYTRPSYSKTGDTHSFQIEETNLDHSYEKSEGQPKSMFISRSSRDDVNKKMDEIEIQLDRLKSMHNQGLITEEEYNSAKRKTLGI